MATQGRETDPPLADVLFEEPYRFEFFQAVRLLERLYPQRKPVGHDSLPAEEVVRFRTRLSLAFPPSEIHEMREADGEAVAEMVVAFMGLLGPLGVLPRHYTSLAIERVRDRDHTLPDFLDVFTHRLVSLFYRAWQKYRLPVAYDSALHEGTWPDRLSRYLLAIAGMGTPGLLGRLSLSDQVLPLYAGLLWHRPRSATALAGILADYFAAPVEIVELVGEWLPLVEANRTRIGAANSTLGRDMVVGSRVWSPQAAFRVRIGPLALEQFDHFLPPNPAFGAMVDMTRLAVGDTFTFYVQPVLARAEVPFCQLGATGPGAPRLGWSTWLKGREFTRDADDVVLAGVPWNPEQ
jgi:type VI secretion system protein ImpH